jgi:hypothetical protein
LGPSRRFNVIADQPHFEPAENFRAEGDASTVGAALMLRLPGLAAGNFIHTFAPQRAFFRLLPSGGPQMTSTAAPAMASSADRPCPALA